MSTLRRYQVSVVGDHEGKYTRDVVALNAGKAKYDYWLDACDAWPDFHWRNLRCRSLGVAWPLTSPVDDEQRRILQVLRHALGLNEFGLDSQGEVGGHRNYYALYETSDDYGFLLALCQRELPLMGMRPGHPASGSLVYFHVTIGGWDFVKRHTGVDHTLAPSHSSTLTPPTP